MRFRYFLGKIVTKRDAYQLEIEARKRGNLETVYIDVADSGTYEEMARKAGDGWSVISIAEDAL